MKTSIEQEIKGTLAHIDFIARLIQERLNQDNNYGFIRYAQAKLRESIEKLKRLQEQIQIQSMEF